MSVPSGANPGGEGQVPPTQGGQVPPPSQPANGQVPSGSDPATQSQQDLTPEQLRDALRKARDDAAKYRTKLDELEAARLAAERAQMTAAERANAELADAKKQLETIRANARQNALEAAVAVKAGPLGIVYPDLALAAIREQVTYGDNDKPQNVDELLRAFIQAHPGLTSAANASANSSIANAPRPQQGVITITRAQRADMRWIENFKQQNGVASLAEAINKGIARFE